MTEPFISRGFTGKHKPPAEKENRTPPGQYLTGEFPVLSTGPTPLINLDTWTFTMEGLVREKTAWSWSEFLQLPSQTFVVDISCVTKWTKLDTTWQGVSVEALVERVDLKPEAAFVTAFSHEGYTANLPLADVLRGRAFIAYRYDEQPLAPEHGGPARLMVPHLYFWKSVKWAAGLRFTEKDQPGFWESAGYHNHGGSWKEERYRSW